ncbi:MAG: ThuA domain-containing protein [Gemmataceae bacterium]
MRWQFASVLVVLCTLVSGVGADEKKARILLIGKELDHPYGTHMYMFECRLLAKCLEQTPGVQTIVSKGWPKDPKTLEGVNSIVFYTREGGDVLFAGKHRKQAIELMKNGVGLVAIHWGTGAGKLTGEIWQKTLGGWFHRRYVGSRLQTTKAEVRPVAPDHPVCYGWKAYPLRDEYYLDLKYMPNTKPVIKVKIGKEDHTIGWVYERPKSKGGRSFGCVLGHFHENFGEKPFRQALINGILWTAHVDVPKAGAPCEIVPKDLVLPKRKK